MRELVTYQKKKNQWISERWALSTEAGAISVLLLATTAETSGSWVFLKKHKLYNLIKRKIYILTTTTIKKHANT